MDLDRKDDGIYHCQRRTCWYTRAHCLNIAACELVFGRLWQRKEVSGWTWKHAGDHISLLEMRAILTSRRWKILRGRLRVRFCV